MNAAACLCLLALLINAPASLAAVPEQQALAEAASLIGGASVNHRAKTSRGVPGEASAAHGEVFHPTERSFQIHLFGPMEDPQQRLVQTYGITRPAPWGGEIKETWTPMSVPDAGREGQPIPAFLWWYWAYPQHFAAARISFTVADGDVSLDQARAALLPIAQAMQRGVQAQGLAQDARAAPQRYRAVIRVGPLKPGDVLSPSVDVFDGRGHPASEERAIAFLINGRFANSVIWDGKRAVIEAQISIAGQALVEQRVIPAYDPNRPIAPAAPVPGMGQVGPLPGPANTREALIGVLGPPIIGLLGRLLAGLGGGKPPPTPPPKPSPPRPRKKRRQGAEQIEPKADKSEGGIDKPESSTDPVQRTLAHLTQVATTTGSKELAQAVDKARQQVFGADGKPDPGAWKEAQKDLCTALGQLHQGIGAPNSAASDAGGALLGAGGEFLLGVGRGAVGLARGVGSFIGNAADGLKAIGEAILNPRTFERGLRESLKQWGNEHLKAENKAIGEGLRDGRYGDALTSFGKAMLKTAWHPVGRLWDFVRSEILPWEEFDSFRNPHASLEEKLWAVPVIAIKIAGILTLLQRPTRQPSTRWGKALQRAGKRPAPPLQTRRAKAPAARTGHPEPARSGAPELRSPPERAPAPAARPPRKSRPDLKKLWREGADGAELEWVVDDAPTVSGHDAVIGERSIESIRRAEHYRFFKVGKRGVRMMEPVAGVEDLCDVLLPKKPLQELTLRDIIVCTDNPETARQMRAQMWRHIQGVLKG
jgi:hypothetical protein